MTDKYLSVCYCNGGGNPVPYVSTMMFPKAELYCLDCGRKAGMFDGFSDPATPELLAEYEKRQAEFDENAANKYLGQFWRGDCEQCQAKHYDENHNPLFHITHATDEEKRAHEEAVVWLAERKAA